MDMEHIFHFQKLCTDLFICHRYSVSAKSSPANKFNHAVCDIFDQKDQPDNILLPKDHYSREELTVIFCHELVHCKHNDPFFKICSIYIGAIQHMTSGAKHILSWINEWSECACDVSAVCALRDVITPRRYFEVIVDLMERMPEDSKPDYIFSTLYESQQSLGRRIEYMKKYVKAKRGAKISAFVLSFLFVVTSMTKPMQQVTEQRVCMMNCIRKQKVCRERFQRRRN